MCIRDRHEACRRLRANDDIGAAAEHEHAIRAERLAVDEHRARNHVGRALAEGLLYTDHDGFGADDAGVIAEVRTQGGSGFNAGSGDGTAGRYTRLAPWPVRPARARGAPWGLAIISIVVASWDCLVCANQMRLLSSITSYAPPRSTDSICLPLSARPVSCSNAP